MDHELINRLRVTLAPWKDQIGEKRMFGGTCFLYKGKMCVGETKGRLMVRVINEKMDDLLSKTSVTPMDFTGKPMKEFIFVQLEGYTTEEQLQYFVELGIEHAESKTKH
jgi:TfoX/Sxy family transcriptional regulator of competence genes